MDRRSQVWTLAGCVLAAALGLGPSPASGQAAAVQEAVDPAARYVANEGFLVEGAGGRVLIDALFRDGIDGYPAPAASVREAVESGSGQWGGVRLALATHYHADHFDAEAVVTFLTANPEADFLSTPQAAAAVLAAAGDRPELARRVEGVLPETGAVVRRVYDDLSLDVLHLHHGEGTNAQNLGFVVRFGDREVIHFGDTEAEHSDFEPYLEVLAEPDLALLPFWFLVSEWRAAMVRDEIRPARIVAAHLPERDAPAGYFGRWGSWRAVVDGIREGFPEAEIPGL